MTKKIEIKGYWYLPESPKNKIAGILSYIPFESLKLELIGTLNNSNFPVLEDINKKNTTEIILGEDSSGNKITLINNFSSESQLNLSSSFPITKYLIQYCLVGIHIESMDDKKFNWSNIEIPKLTDWCFLSRLKQTFTLDAKNNFSQINISCDFKNGFPPINSTKVNEFTTLEIQSNVYFKEGKFGKTTSFQESTFLKIKKSVKSSLNEILSDIFLYKNFLSLASLSTVIIDEILLFNVDNFQEVGKGKKIFHPIELMYVQDDNLQAKKNLDNLFSYRQIENLYPKIITKWFNDTTQINPIKRHLIESIKKKKSFMSIDFLIIIQAIEGYCIRFRKEQSLAKMLESIIDEFKDIDKIVKSNIDIRRTVDSRHYYSHFMNKSKKPKTLEGKDLYDLTQKLRLLLICCLLNFIGIGNEKINELLNQTRNNYC